MRSIAEVESPTIMKRGLHSRGGHAPASRQRGAALLFVVLLLVIGIGVFVVNTSAETARIAASERRLGEALNKAKQGLVAFAVGHATRPGAMPCPDADDDGIAEPLLFTGACPSYLGRLPWKTLGVGDIRDTDGQRLWYALSERFRDFPQINSDTKGNRVVRSGASAIMQTVEAVAVLFAPGAVLPGQSRDATPAPCSTTSTTVAPTLCAANYLDAAAAVNNAAAPGTGPFIAADASPAFNDRLVVLRAADIVPLIERRVASDLRRVLVNYRDAARLAITGGGCNCYPWADGDYDGISNTGINRGRIPLTAQPHNWGATVADATGVVYTLPSLPAYFQANNWQTVIYYAVGRNALENLGVACTTCTADPVLPPPALLKGTLSVDQGIGHAVVLITPGSAGANRPGGWTGNWGDYIDDGANRDADDRFVTPAAKTFDRDRLFTLPDDAPPASCNSNAKILIYHAPCHTTGTDVKPVCARAAKNLQFCAMCSGDGTVMVEEPCRNALSPPECQAAVANLQGCRL